MACYFEQYERKKFYDCNLISYYIHNPDKADNSSDSGDSGNSGNAGDYMSCQK